MYITRKKRIPPGTREKEISTFNFLPQDVTPFYARNTGLSNLPVPSLQAWELSRCPRIYNRGKHIPLHDSECPARASVRGEDWFRHDYLPFVKSSKTIFPNTRLKTF